MHIQYDLYGHALAQEPCPWGYEIFNFALIIITKYLVCLLHAMKKRRRFLKK